VFPTWHPDEGTAAAVFYITSSGRSARLSLYSRQAGVSGFWCPRLERPSSPRRICAVTGGFQTTTQDLSVFPFLPRHYHMTRVLPLPFITTVWTPVVLAIINIIKATSKMLMMMMHYILYNWFIKRHKVVTSEALFLPRNGRNHLRYSLRLPTEGWPGWVGWMAWGNTWM